jgi:alkanesulfonate monooxygenase SsuD/methylene tetrahydromethanopterin reductase-like flavin-dependent oxidoreductase (luciferase family)
MFPIVPWLFEFFHQRRDAPAAGGGPLVHDHFEWYTDLWTRCEDRGFHGIFFSEHHFGAGYSPSPNLLVAHMAARTTKLRLGVLGVVSGYATPWRVAEEFAMLDHLTGGRLEMGVVSGIPPEMATAGIDHAARLRRHREVMDVLSAAIAASSTGVAVTHRGPEWAFTDVRLLPPFLQDRPVPWTAARSVDSAAAAGARGWRVCLGFLDAQDLAGLARAHAAAADRSGHASGSGQIGLRRLVTFVDRTSAQRSGMHAAKRRLLDVLTASAGGLPPWASLLDRPDEHNDALSDEEFIAGTPEQVAEEIVRQCATVGAGHFVATFSAMDRTELAEAHEAYAEYVIPRVSAPSEARAVSRESCTPP